MSTSLSSLSSLVIVRYRRFVIVAIRIRNKTKEIEINIQVHDSSEQKETNMADEIISVAEQVSRKTNNKDGRNRLRSVGFGDFEVFTRQGREARHRSRDRRTKNEKKKCRHLFVALQMCLPAAVVLRLVGGHLKTTNKRPRTVDRKHWKYNTTAEAHERKCSDQRVKKIQFRKASRKDDYSNI